MSRPQTMSVFLGIAVLAALVLTSEGRIPRKDLGIDIGGGGGGGIGIEIGTGINLGIGGGVPGPVLLQVQAHQRDPVPNQVLALVRDQGLVIVKGKVQEVAPVKDRAMAKVTALVAAKAQAKDPDPAMARAMARVMGPAKDPDTVKDTARVQEEDMEMV
ncbi:hypothetical protein C2845_PM04G12660 [Panicum miliaceum]|uniref:Uncharacterized protein n=1 Tax=Panicum miliaceum TaxID=4540 RepID=A0A3L6QRS2_PANMI|nr:hypothetical protein C2845_PM04G12660 [Panicum miliaceum]